MLHRSSSLFLALALALALAACGPSTSTPDSGVGGDTGPPTDAPPGDAPAVDGGGMGNNDFDTATPVELDADPDTADAIERPSDVDFFSFSGTEGQWVAVYTATEPPAMPDDPFADTVITLYGTDRMPLAENDDALPRAGTDSEVIIRLPATGTYFYRVQEFSTWAPDMVDPPGPRGGAAFTYTTGVLVLEDADPRIRVDAEPGDDAATASPVDLAGGAAFLLGRFDDAGDVDVFSFNSTSTATSPEALNIAVMPAGPMGYGATRTAGRLWVTGAGGEIIARAPVGEDVIVLSPALLEGAHHLWIESQSGALGTNDHYVVKFFWGTENPRERNEATNGVFATPEPRTLTAVEGAEGMAENAFVFGRLTAGDVDYYSFDVMAGREVSLVCGSRTAGSGVLGLTADLRSATDMSLGMSVETDTDGAFVDGIGVAPGSYLMRISATGQDPMVTGNWYRCRIFAGAPAP